VVVTAFIVEVERPEEVFVALCAVLEDVEEAEFDGVLEQAAVVRATATAAMATSFGSANRQCAIAGA
jgi:hypothetical protein